MVYNQLPTYNIRLPGKVVSSVIISTLMTSKNITHNNHKLMKKSTEAVILFGGIYSSRIVGHPFNGLMKLKK